MAWLEQNSTGHFHIVFRFDGARYRKSTRTKDGPTAEARLHRVNENIRLVECGRLTIPEDADIATFLLSDGRINGKSKPATIRTLTQLCDAFMASIPPDSLEESTITGMETHIRHLKRILRGATLVRELQLEKVQNYIDRRSKEKGMRGKNISPATIKKELTTLRLMWNWARNAGHFQVPLPRKGLRFPKTTEKPSFQTWADIERKIARGGISANEEAELWDCLFLTLPEIDALLRHVKKAANHPFIHPMFMFAAHTGARRSEMLRSRIDDIDLDGKTATIREKKRVRGKLTTRSVPLSPQLASVLREWFVEHPGGQYTFCLGIRWIAASVHGPNC